MREPKQPKSSPSETAEAAFSSSFSPPPSSRSGQPASHPGQSAFRLGQPPHVPSSRSPHSGSFRSPQATPNPQPSPKPNPKPSSSIRSTRASSDFALFRSLHMKLVLILVLLIVSVMAAVGTFLMNSVSTFYLGEFYDQIERVFTDEMRYSIVEAAHAGDADAMQEILAANAGALGVSDYRNYYILDGQGKFLRGSNEALGLELTRTRNIIAAMAGEVGYRNNAADSTMDYAIPVEGASGSVEYILYIADDKRQSSNLSWQLFQIVMQAMMFGLLAAILLSFLLSKTITNPIERITEGAKRIAEGNFGKALGIESSDEIGELTRSFNYMAERLKTTIDEVQDERDKLNTLFLHMTDGVAAFTTDGTLIHMNPATETMLGVQAEAPLTFDELFPDLEPPHSDESAVRSFMTSELIRNERVLSVTLAPYGEFDSEDGNGGVIAVLHDITEQRKLDEARREFVANVSHELRTPLTNIRSYTETLLDALGEIPLETEQQFLGVINSESERMARIVTDLLTLSKLDYGRMELCMKRFSVGELLHHVADAMQLTVQENGHQFHLDIPDTLPDMVGDPERLEQVVVNIVSNSVKYTPTGGHIFLSACRMTAEDDRAKGGTGGQTARTQVGESTREPTGEQVRIVVQDNGIGIPKEDVPRLFERFYRVDKARSREAGGTGLGLAIAKEIVERHRGYITLESEYGKGTRVSITLPTDLPLGGLS